MIERVLAFLRRRSSATEEATEYDGFLSYAGEFHALAAGFAAGFTAGQMESVELLAGTYALALGVRSLDSRKRLFRGRGITQEIQREPWYAIGAATLGFVLGGGAAALPTGYV